MEQIRILNQKTGLQGIVSLRKEAGPQEPAIIIPADSSGSPAGPFRRNVLLARAITEQGNQVVRVEPHDTETTFAEQISNAINYLCNNCNIHSFIVFASSENSDELLDIAVHEQRITGICLLDGAGFRTSGFFKDYLLLDIPKRLAHRDTWRPVESALAKLLSTKAEPAVQSAETLATDIEQKYNSLPQPTECRNQARYRIWRLLRRDVRIHLIFTGGAFRFFNNALQVQQMYGDLDMEGRISSDYAPLSDHHLTLPGDRKTMIRSVLQWVTGFQPGVSDNTDDIQAA